MLLPLYWMPVLNQAGNHNGFAALRQWHFGPLFGQKGAHQIWFHLISTGLQPGVWPSITRLNRFSGLPAAKTAEAVRCFVVALITQLKLGANEINFTTLIRNSPHRSGNTCFEFFARSEKSPAITRRGFEFRNLTSFRPPLRRR
jgi:hypothetical protein